jgi:hypothetical protein
VGVLDDIRRLGLKLEKSDVDEIQAITDRTSAEKDDELVQLSLTDMRITEYLSIMRPDIMDELVKERERQNAEWIRRTQAKYDDRGARVCDEQLCDSVQGVTPCRYCGKYICRGHDYSKGHGYCYDCWTAQHGDEDLCAST